MDVIVIARSEATKQSRVARDALDCFRLRPVGFGGQVASLAMTEARSFLLPRRQAETGQQRLAAETGEARQIRQA
ncbi:MAG: hypothetical protein WA418_18620, partial [Bradyrhizobium sp.]